MILAAGNCPVCVSAADAAVTQNIELATAAHMYAFMVVDLTCCGDGQGAHHR
jgi:hypothetical protein